MKRDGVHGYVMMIYMSEGWCLNDGMGYLDAIYHYVFIACLLLILIDEMYS